MVSGFDMLWLVMLIWFLLSLVSLLLYYVLLAVIWWRVVACATFGLFVLGLDYLVWVVLQEVCLVVLWVAG